MAKDKIKEFLIDLALMTRDCEWAEEISKKEFDMTPYPTIYINSDYVNSEKLSDKYLIKELTENEAEEIWRRLSE